MRQTLLKVKEYFDANLETFVRQAEDLEGITIERWRFMEIYENHSNQFPSIEILPAETRIDYGDENKPILEGVSHFNVDLDISAAGTTPEVINNTLLGYEKGVKLLLEDDETFGRRFIWVTVRSIPFSPMIREGRTGRILKILTFGLRIRNT